MKWITRKDVKVDRVACPWLIRRFIDPQAEFLFVEERDLLEESTRHRATPFDAPKIEGIKLNHRGSRCTFEAIIEDYSLSDPAIHQLGLIVRAADVHGQEAASPEGAGLRSIAQGFAAGFVSRLQSRVYAALSEGLFIASRNVFDRVVSGTRWIDPAAHHTHRRHLRLLSRSRLHGIYVRVYSDGKRNIHQH
jgi:hypothetical protein